MNLYVLIAFMTPISLVAVMWIFNNIFAGWKTNTQGVLLAGMAAVQGMDLTFIPQDISTALIAGSALGVALASKLTKRAAA